MAGAKKSARRATAIGAPQGNRNAVGNPGGGRRSAYQPEYARIAGQLALLGATDAEIAAALGVTERTVNNWKRQHVEFLSALKEGKLLADAEVARSLYQRALGYSHEDVHISNFQGEITVTPLVKHYPPDTVAAIFWLKNRQPEKWRDRIEQQADVTLTAPDDQDLYRIFEERMRISRERQAAVLRERGLTDEPDTPAGEPHDA